MPNSNILLASKQATYAVHDVEENVPILHAVDEETQRDVARLHSGEYAPSRKRDEGSVDGQAYDADRFEHEKR